MITRTRARTPDVICLPAGPVSQWRRRPTKKTFGLAGATFLALAGCTTFGSNIEGNFTCSAAGEGTCAPATVIDDRALALIGGSDPASIPAGPFRPLHGEMRPPTVIARGGGGPAPIGGPVPAGQKVLRIVFPAHVDGAGRYHETSVVRAVVDNGQWLRASAPHASALAGAVDLTVNPEILALLSDTSTGAQADASTSQQVGMSGSTQSIVLPGDPSAPSAQAVAAARARAAAKVASSAQDAAQLASSASGAPVNRPASFNPVVEE